MLRKEKAATGIEAHWGDQRADMGAAEPSCLYPEGDSYAMKQYGRVVRGPLGEQSCPGRRHRDPAHRLEAVSEEAPVSDFRTSVTGHSPC